MLDKPRAKCVDVKTSGTSFGHGLPDEHEFYAGYDWCLNPHLRVGEALGHLREELDKFDAVASGWQFAEVATNVFLLACGVLNCVDEYLRGPSLRLPGRLGKSTLGRAGAKLVEAATSPSRRHRLEVRRWRTQWVLELNDILALTITVEAVDRASFVEAAGRLKMLVDKPLPADLQGRYLNVPSPFRRLDMTHLDVLVLGRALVERMPDRLQPLLLVGLRTSGSYFAPLLKAMLEAEGYEAVSFITMEPNKGAGREENRDLELHARLGYMAIIVDDPPDTGGTVYAALSIARRAGFSEDRLRILVPAHPIWRTPFRHVREGLVISTDPEHWHKRQLLDVKAVKGRLAEYFAPQGLKVARVSNSAAAKAFNAQLQKASYVDRATRLKRVFEVELVSPDGARLTRYVLAKSVGWGWLGYHAFVVGHRLSGFVPAFLGLRDGIAYMQWIAQPAGADPRGLADRGAWIDASAAYVAARVRTLALRSLSQAGMDLARQNNGIRLAEKALSRAYGRFLTDTLMRSHMGAELRRQPCPVPTVVDGNMQRSEWVQGPDGLLKTDYEHHGMGKAGLNVTDPAFDLASAILQFELSGDEEVRLVQRYRALSGDDDVAERLFLNKLLAGFWGMNQAQDYLFGGLRDGAAQQELNRQFLRAWNFLTVQAARYCGSMCPPRKAPEWRGPLLALDIDGVIDRRLFGFPCTSAAGMEALSLLNANDISVTVNTARSVSEVKDYCAAYGLCGGVAEHGAYLWDAVGERGEVLICDETARQMEQLRERLRQVPGVFLDDRHRYSIRALTYQDKPRGLALSLLKSMHAASVGDGAVGPLPGLVANRLMAELGLDRLSFHHTLIDTTFVAKETNKGTGLVALRDMVLSKDAETIAVGDSEPDLAMFAVATRSFAPANISCANQARHLGCRIVGRPFQRGLLQIAQAITGADDAAVKRMGEAWTGKGLFMDLLRVSDRHSFAKLVRAMLDRRAFRIFLR